MTITNSQELASAFGLSIQPVDQNSTVQEIQSYRIERKDLSNLNIGSLESNQQVKLEELLLKNGDLFAKDGELPGRTGIIKHRILTGDAAPIIQRAYRSNPRDKEFIQNEIAKLMKQGLIQESKSPWASPIVIVPKKNGKLRMCVDYRAVNNVTKGDAYPLPRIDDMLESLNGASWFTSLDLASGFWQVEMDEEDKEKTAFISHNGLYEFTIMPFGLKGAPATFQRLMNIVYSGLAWTILLVYLDDTIVYADTFDQHLNNLQQTFG